MAIALILLVGLAVFLWKPGAFDDEHWL